MNCNIYKVKIEICGAKKMKLLTSSFESSKINLADKNKYALFELRLYISFMPVLEICFQMTFLSLIGLLNIIVFANLNTS